MHLKFELILIYNKAAMDNIFSNISHHRPVASRWQTFSHNVVYGVHRAWAGLELTTLVVIGTLIAQAAVNPTTMRPRRPQKHYI
jgi:hypothetical protein